MSVSVRIPALLRGLTGGAPEVQVEAGSLGELVAALEARHPGIRARLVDPQSGELVRYVNIYINREDARRLGGLEAPLKDGDQVAIIPAIAGGES